ARADRRRSVDVALLVVDAGAAGLVGGVGHVGRLAGPVTGAGLTLGDLLVRRVVVRHRAVVRGVVGLGHVTGPVTTDRCRRVEVVLAVADVGIAPLERL